MLKNINKHLQKNPILISLSTIIIIFTIVALPILLNRNNKDSSDTKKFLENLVANVQQSSLVSSQSSVLLKSSNSSVLSSTNSSLLVSSPVTQLSKTEVIPKPIEKVNPPAVIESINTNTALDIKLQTNIEKNIISQPKPIIKEVSKPIVQNIIETKPTPIITPVPVIEAPKPVVDNSYVAVGCDQSLASQMLEIVNSHRLANRAKKLSISTQLSNIGCAHSRWMTASGIFSHTGKDSTSPFERCKKAGTYCYAENVAYNTTPNVQDLFEQFKNSPGHNQNMLDPNFVEVGIAFDGIYVTQVFR
jgi:uncharacterized protein YkwD